MAVMGARPATGPWFLGRRRRTAADGPAAAPARRRPAERHPARRRRATSGRSSWRSPSRPPSRSSTSASRPASRRRGYEIDALAATLAARRAEQQQLIMADRPGADRRPRSPGARDSSSAPSRPARRHGRHVRTRHGTPSRLTQPHAAERGRRNGVPTCSPGPTAVPAHVVLLLVAAIAASVIGARLVWWQVVQQAIAVELGARAARPAGGAPGGTRRDHATSTARCSPPRSSCSRSSRRRRPIADPARTATAPCLRSSTCSTRRAARELGGRPAVGLAEAQVTPEAAERIRSLDLRGIGMLPETKRVYPIQGIAAGTTLAAQLLGFVDVNGDGQYGVEGGENAILAGTPGTVSAQEDVIGRRIADSATLLREPLDGSDLRLTLDAGVQHMLEQEMWSTYQNEPCRRRDRPDHGCRHRARSWRWRATRRTTRMPSRRPTGTCSANPAVARQYEPGSVMKAFTIAAALDAERSRLKDTVRRRQQPRRSATSASRMPTATTHP